MAGYHGFSMSNNALDAYEDGEKPLSKWTKAEIMEVIEQKKDVLNCSLEVIKKLPVKELKCIALYKSSWHHTSKHFNKTDFYAVDMDMLARYTDKELLDIIAKKKNEKKNQVVEEPVEEMWECTFLEWGGTRKHPKATEYTEVGMIKGNWFYRKDGSKKSIKANGFQMNQKVQ